MEIMEMRSAVSASRTPPRGPARPELAPVGEIDAQVGKRVRARREALGMSQGWLGRELGVTFSQVQKYEKGSNRIGAGRLFHIAALLGVPVQYFFETVGTQPAPAAPKHQALATAEAERLQDTFARISDPHRRQALISLASSMIDAPRDDGEEPAG